MVGRVYPRGAVGSRPKPWTRLCCSESHWSNPVGLPVGQPRAPASSTRLPIWFVSWWTECGDSAACIFCGWIGLRFWIHYNLILCVYCKALQVFQGRWHPEMSWTLLWFACSRTCNNESNVAEDITGMAELACTILPTFGFLLRPSVEAPPCLAHSVCTMLILVHVPHLCEYCLGASLAEINHFAGLHSSPMKLGVCIHLWWHFGS